MAANQAKRKNTTASGSSRSRNTSKSGSRPKTGNKSKPASASRRKRKSEGFFSVYREEIILVVTLMLSVLLLLSNFHLCGTAGDFINNAVFGLFGVLAYLFPFLLFFGTAFYLSNRGNRSIVRKIVCAVLLFFAVTALLQMFSYGSMKEMKLLELYTQSSKAKNGGGLIGGSFAMLLCHFFDLVGAYIILVAMILILAMLLTEKLLFASLRRSYQEHRAVGGRRMRVREKSFEDPEEDFDLEDYEDNLEDNVIPIQSFEENGSQRKRKLKRSEAVKASSSDSQPADMREIVPTLFPSFETEAAEPSELSHYSGLLAGESAGAEASAELPAGRVVYLNPVSPVSTASAEPEISVPHAFETAEEFTEQEEVPQEEVPEEGEDFTVDVGGMFAEETPAVSESQEEAAFSPSDPIEDEKQRILGAKSIEGNKPLDSYAKTARVPEAGMAEGHSGAPHSGMSATMADAGGPKTMMATPPVIKPITKPYQFPPLDLLSRPKPNPKAIGSKELQETARTLQKTLESFGVKVTVTNVSCGPAVTRYELQPERGVKVSRITGLSDDIKLNLAAADIRIEAPIPGKAAVGIEVPNKENSTVLLRELMESQSFNDHPSKIAFAVGKDIGGQTVVTDIAKMPHLLIAGATGSGKSVCINTLIMSILYKADPNDVKLIMVDPKVVELSVYNGIPHLLIPVVTDPKKASAALNWGVMEMTERYQRFAELGVRDIKGFNEKVSATPEYREDARFQKMPQIVIIVDELADLMMVAPGEVEDAICRLAQLARAAGIHLIIATQRPSVNVITGLIKANVPSRIAFAVSSAIDSRTIIDGSGAEKLLGKGDMLFFPTGYPKPIRVQGAFVSDKEVTEVVEFLTKQNEGHAYSEAVVNQIAASSAPAADNSAGAGAGSAFDEYFAEAAKFIIEKDKASIGMLQRVYKIGFNRAARIMDQLCEAGVVGPEEGTKPRKILMTQEEFEAFISEMNGG